MFIKCSFHPTKAQEDCMVEVQLIVLPLLERTGGGSANVVFVLQRLKKAGRCLLSAIVIHHKGPTRLLDIWQV